MTALATQILDSIRQLAPEEQLEVARTIQAEVQPGTTDGISNAVWEEAERRLEEYRRDPSTAISHEESRAEMKALLSKFQS